MTVTLKYPSLHCDTKHAKYKKLINKFQRTELVVFIKWQVIVRLRACFGSQYKNPKAKHSATLYLLCVYISSLLCIVYSQFIIQKFTTFTLSPSYEQRISNMTGQSYQSHDKLNSNATEVPLSGLRIFFS